MSTEQPLISTRPWGNTGLWVVLLKMTDSEHLVLTGPIPADEASDYVEVFNKHLEERIEERVQARIRRLVSSN